MSKFLNYKISDIFMMICKITHIDPKLAYNSIKHYQIIVSITTGLSMLFTIEKLLAKSNVHNF